MFFNTNYKTTREYYIYKNGYLDGRRDATFNIINDLVDNKMITDNNTTVDVSVSLSPISLDSIALVNFNEAKGTTVVKWADGTITKVKTQNGDTYSPEVGLAMCIAKKAMGNKGNYNNVFKKWLPKTAE